MAGKLSLPKILTTASAFALIGVMANSAVGAEATSVNNPSSFSVAGDWDIVKILADQDYITLGGNHGVTADLGIYIEDIVVGANTLNSLNIDATAVRLGNITLGGGTPGQVVISAGNSLTLVGGDRTYREAGANAVAADYSGIHELDFGAGSSLTTDTAATAYHQVSGNVGGASDAITFTGAVTNGANGALNVNTDLNVSDASWFDIGAINIGSVASPAIFSADLTQASAIDGATLSFTHVDSELSIKSTKDISLSNNLGGAVDGSGKITITTTSDDISVNDGGNGQIGVDDAGKVNILSFAGNKATKIKVPVFATEIDATGDTNSTVTFFKDVTATDMNIGAGTVAIDSTDANITLESNVSFTDADNGTLLFQGGNNLNLKGDIAADTVGRGTIEVAVGAPSLSIQGKVGDGAGHSLGLLDIKGDTVVSFNTDDTAVHVNKVNFDADGYLRFARANREYKIDEITTSTTEQGNIRIREHTVFKSNGGTINFGTEAARLNALEFQSSRNLTFEDGVNLYVKKIFNARGELIFKGTSILDSTDGNADVNIKLSDDANLTLIVPSTTINNALILDSANATLVLKKDFSIGEIKNSVAGHGRLKFDNQDAAMTITFLDSNILSVGGIEFAGKDVNLGIIVDSPSELQFTSATPMTATFTGLTNSIGGSVFTNTSGATHTVVLSNALTSFSKDLATSTSSQLNFQLDNGIDAEITAGDATGSNFTTGTNDKGELELNNSGMTINSVGANSLALNKLTFTENASVTGDVYATNISVADGKSASFGGNVTGDIESANPANGTLNFTGTSTVSGNVGANGSFATINATGDVKFTDAVETSAMNIGAGQVTFDSSSAPKTLGAAIEFTSDLGGEILVTGANNTTFAGNMALTSGDRGIVEIDASVGANTVEFRGQVGNNANDNALNLLDVKGDSIVKFTTNTNVHINKINLDADGTVYLAKSGGEYKFEDFSNTNGNGTLQLSQNVTLKSTGSTVNFGTSSNRLKALNFTAPKILTLEDGVNIYVDTITQTGGTGTFIFYGTSILDINKSSASNVGDVSVKNGGNLTFVAPSGYDTKSYFIIEDKATLIFNSDVQIGGIGAGGQNQGILKFENQANMSLTDTANGDISLLESMEFDGKDVVLNAKINGIGEFNFTSATPMTATFTGLTNSIGGSVFTNTSGVTHTVVLSDALTSFSQDLATSTSSQLNFQLDDGVNAEINSGDATGSNFTTGTDGKGELELNNSGMTINRVGTSSASLGKLIFSENASVTEGVYASTISIADTKIVNLTGVVKTDKLNFEGVSAQANFADGITINGAIAGDVPGGIANFAGDIDLNYGIGSASAALSKVAFADDASKKTTLGADIYATDVVLNKSAVALSKNVTITGNTTTNSTSINLDGYRMQNNGNMTMSGTNTVKFKIQDTGAGTTISGGNIASSGVLQLNSGAKLVLEPQDSNVTAVVGTPRRFFVASASSVQGVGASQIQVVQNNKDLNWTVVVDNNGISLLEDWGRDVYLENFATQNSENAGVASKFINAKAGSDADKMKQFLGDLAKNVGSAKVDEALELITNAGEAVGEARAGIMSSVVDSIAGRTLTTAALEFASSNEISGVGAGDAYSQLGAWFSPFYGGSSQGKRGDLPGYQSKLYGATLGFDAKFYEDLILGMSVSISHSDIKHKGLKLGDTTKMNSYLLSIYGLKHLSDKVFWAGSATINRNDVSNSSKRVASANGYEMASARYVADSFSTQHMVGVNNRIGAAVVTPMVGLRYRRDAVVHYNESGAAFQNLEVRSKAQSQLDVIAGVKSSGYLACNVSGKAITSEVRGFVNYALSNHTSRQKINLDGVEFISEAKKPARLKYNFGLGVNAIGDGLDYGASYDLNLSDKLVGHQGSIKVRAEF